MIVMYYTQMSLVVFKKRNLLLNILDNFITKKLTKKDAKLVSVFDIPSETTNTEFNVFPYLPQTNTQKLNIVFENTHQINTPQIQTNTPQFQTNELQFQINTPQFQINTPQLQNITPQKSFLKDLLWGHTYDDPNTPDRWDPFVCKIEKRLYSKKLKRYLLEVSDCSAETHTVHIGTQLFSLIKDNIIKAGDTIKVNYYSATNMHQESGISRLVLFTNIEKI